MELYVLSVLSPGKNLPDSGGGMKKSDIYQRISGLALDQDIIHIHLRFYTEYGEKKESKETEQEVSGE